MAAQALTLEPIINLQSDTAATPGNSMMIPLEVAATNAINAVAAAGVQEINGRMPFDPADPNFGTGVIQVRGVQGGSIMPTITPGLLILGLVLWLIFRKKK